MAPVENEAVVAATLHKTKGSVELVDCRDRLPGLKTSRGLTKWVIMDKLGQLHDKYSHTDEMLSLKLTESMFHNDDGESLGLDKCIRIDPHLQNTGGFFVAVLKKTKPYGQIDHRSNDADAGNIGCCPSGLHRGHGSRDFKYLLLIFRVRPYR